MVGRVPDSQCSEVGLKVQVINLLHSLLPFLSGDLINVYLLCVNGLGFINFFQLRRSAPLERHFTGITMAILKV